MSRGFYDHEAGRISRELGGSLSEVMRDTRLFRALLAETDGALRAAHRAGRLPPGIVSDDLIERTRAALAGETKAKPMTTAEAVAAAVDRLSKPQAAD